MLHHVTQVFFKYLRREIDVPGKDLCDMSGVKGRTPDEFSVYNVMLPRIYHPAWKNNLFEQRCKVMDSAEKRLPGKFVCLLYHNTAAEIMAWMHRLVLGMPTCPPLSPHQPPCTTPTCHYMSPRAHASCCRSPQAHATQDIADQLQGGDMAVDYDQILAKRPNSSDSIFAWHQDMAYWPPLTSSTATATCWLAVSDSSVENGCMRFVPGSHKEAELRRHRPGGR